MRKKIKWLLGLVVFFVGAFGLQALAAPSTPHTQDLIIVKYGLSPGATAFAPDQTNNTGEKINNLPTDNLGKQLSPMAGIHYLVQSVNPVGGSTPTAGNSKTYTPSGTPVDIITDSSGLAALTLPDGFYLVSEQANNAAGLSHPAPPVLISLPVLDSTRGSGWLSRVYIYPKSSIDKGETVPGNPGTSNPSNPTVSAPDSGNTAMPPDGGQGLLQRFLPSTGDKISALAVMLGAAILIFVAVVKWRERRESEQEEQ